ncbi:cytochrome P450 3A24-like [Daphnia pulex]|uniref:cytochrome P450 3A24-like n=1 Tax=Daphnia pulex TaxID=6669 RepID=UPI001EE06E9E|nr:cytochrome P450 3A24-like [Daphnia pulex]
MGNNISGFSSIICASGVLISIWVFQRWKALNYLQSYGIVCPNKAHFIYGNLHQLRWSKTKSIQEKQTEWLTKYGKVVGYYMGLKPRIMLADLDILKEVLMKDINIFTNRPDVPRGMPTLVSLRDERWKEVRHVLTPTYSLLKLKAMFPTINECTDLFINILKERSDPSTELEIYEPFQGLTLDVISRCALALQLDCQRNIQDEILEAVRKFFRLDLSRIVVMLVCFPGLRSFFRILFRFAPSNKLIAFVLNHVRLVVDRRRQAKEAPALIDALHLLLEASEGKHSEIKTGKLSSALLNDDEIAWNACVFLLAGYETTSTALAYVTYCLSLYPDIQEKVFDEIIEKIGSDLSALSYDDVSKLQYLELVILESLRLFPPVPLFVSRECKETTTINGITIPVDCAIDVPVWSIHRDPELWEEPLTFDPLRHLPEEKTKRHPLAFLPFGAGPRNCIGARFAMLEMKCTIANLVRHFTIKTSEKNPVPLPTVVRTTIMNPSNGVWIKLVKR